MSGAQSHAPISLAWNAETKSFWPLKRFARIADERYGHGEVIDFVEIEERSAKSHRHYFVMIREAWRTLPDGVADQYATPEALRKRALVMTGFCTVTDYACPTQAEALRWAKNLRAEADDYAVVVVREGVVRVMRPKSQSVPAMKKDEFQRSKDAVLSWIADLLGVTVQQLAKAEAA